MSVQGKTVDQQRKKSKGWCLFDVMQLCILMAILIGRYEKLMLYACFVLYSPLFISPYNDSFRWLYLHLMWLLVQYYSCLPLSIIYHLILICAIAQSSSLLHVVVQTSKFGIAEPHYCLVFIITNVLVDNKSLSVCVCVFPKENKLL